ARVEPRLEIVLFGAADVVKGIQSDVVIGHHQTIRGYERPRPAVVEPDRSQLNLLQPGVGNLEAVSLLDLRSRHVVEKPHALIRKSRHESRSEERDQQGAEKYFGSHSGTP